MQSLKLVAVLSVALLQIAVGVFLYRARVVDHSPASDALVFLAPVAFSILANAAVLGVATAHGRTRWRAVLLAGLAGAVAFVTTMLVNLNVYGS